MMALAGAALILAQPLPAADTAPRAAADALAAGIVARMTEDEKVNQLVNVAPAIPRLGIPAYNWWTESLHGAIGVVPTTNFPEPIGLAATFDAPLVHEVAGVISVEVAALHTLGRQTGKLGKIGTGLDTWSPNINIFRDPRWGRGQETYGEDPYLTARLGVAFVTGMQGPDPEHPAVIATPKHFAVHSGPEPSRHVDDIWISDHDLEDTYLPAFRAAIVEGKAGSIMCAYNRVAGQPACVSDVLLRQHLRGAWGFTGYVVSDCDAVVDIYDHHRYAPDAATGVAVALKSGVDNECNTRTLGGATNLGDRYKEALQRGLITQTDLDRALVRLFSARLRNGDLPGVRPVSAVPVAAIGTPDHQARALQAAAESLVLLKNDGVLPLKTGAKVALVGPLADATRVLRGNYSSTQSAPPVSALEGLRQRLGAGRLIHVPFGTSITDGDPVPGSAFRTPDGKPGLKAEYYSMRGAAPTAPGMSASYDPQPTVTRVEQAMISTAARGAQLSEENKVVWSGFLVPPETGTYRIAVTGVKGELTVDGRAAIAATDYARRDGPLQMTEVRLIKGQRYPLRFQSEGSRAQAGIFWKRVSTDPDRDLAAGVAKADVVVAVVGLTSDLEGEEMPVKVEGFAGGDKTSLDLPADQRALLEKARALGKPLIVVVMNGSPVNLAWAKANASAIVEAWYPGQAGGLAIADALTGRSDFGGRLPLTFYGSIDDLPPFNDYTMKGRTYRYFTGTPVYPFGYGLSYTSFGYAPLRLEPAASGPEQGLRVTTEITNTGQRAGSEVAQLYLNFPDEPGVPRVALRGFQRLSLKPGERRTVTFDLSPRDLSSVAPDGTRRVAVGRYRVTVGSGQPESGVAGQSANFTTAAAVVLPK
ncbi:glycoside hydrolase family 3 C-terminal domain-containing protein [Sphingomonas quercus]|uniref:Glycoside hydrolase family 3 C-terminal domain-containing protein n=1 Tax=Sphingomonas quercus TaxID=2842451 RepID=A0ABS6BGR1_9SPHN|nr:glycoside hydrolase family 3 C-terminal domain-containing protein [Sphingomonas quercus]MBU3077374.1 glycoside hydrolase family 3 C-terminal domain-containing protein [Sphingomonas quercus]